MKLTRFCIRESRLTLVFLVMVFLGGIYSFYALPAAEDPPFIFRFSVIQTLLPGTPPEVMDQSVTGPIEELLLENPEVDYTESVSREGFSLITVKLKDRVREPAGVWDQLQIQLEGKKEILPNGLIGPRLNRNMGRIYGVLIGFSSDELNWREMQDILKEIRRELLELPVVGEAKVIGDLDERVEVEMDVEGMLLSGVSPLDIPDAILARSHPLPGGKLTSQSGEMQRVASSGNLTTVEALKSTPVQLADEEVTMPLSEFADIGIEFESNPSEVVRIRGRQGLILAVSLREGGKIQELGSELDAMINSWKKRYQGLLDIEKITDEPQRVDRKLNGLFINLVESMGIVCVVLVLVLGLREGVVVAMLIPLSILLSFSVMKISGIGMNHVAVGGFIVVLGMLVDNNIVVAERIIRNRSRGRSPIEAAVSATTELHKPLIVAALTTITAFLPIFMANSAAGEYTRPLFQVVAITLLSSEAIVFMITPLLSIYFFGDKRRLKKMTELYGKHPFYRKLLVYSIKRRPWVLMVTLGAIILAIMGLSRIPIRFFPPSDRPILVGELELDPGRSLEETMEVASGIDQILADQINEEGHLETWATFIGRSAPRFVLNQRERRASPEYAYFLMNPGGVGERQSLRLHLREHMREHFPDLNFRVVPLEVGPAIGYPVQVRLSGGNGDIPTLVNAANELKQRLSEIPGVARAGMNWGGTVESHKLDFDLVRAAEQGLTRKDLAAILQTVFHGLEVTQMVTEEGIFPVLLTVPESWRDNSEDILGMEFQSPATGRVFQLGNIATVEKIRTYPKISRFSGRRAITVWADPVPGVTPTLVDAEIKEWLLSRGTVWRKNDQIEFAFRGEGFQAEIANKSLMKQLPLVAVIILLLLIYQMRSLRRTVVVLSSIPLGFIGAVAGLYLTGQYLSFMALVGLVSLSGIVVNSAILLLDRIRLNLEEAGLEPLMAVLDAAEQRFRAILLTAATTMGGMTPLLLFGGEFWRPLAVSLVFGLGLSTLLILIVIPVGYTYLFKIPVHKASHEF